MKSYIAKKQSLLVKSKPTKIAKGDILLCEDFG